MPPEELPPITKQELLFCEAYLERRIAVHAVLKAGMSDNYASAAVIGSRLLKNVIIRAWLAYMRRQQARELRITVPKILREYAIIALSNVEDFALDGETGQLQLDAGLPLAFRRAVKKRKVTKKERCHGRGEKSTVTVETTAEIELHDKLHALDQLMKHFKGIDPKGPGQLDCSEQVMDIIAGYLSQAVEDGESPPGTAAAGGGAPTDQSP